MQRFFLRKLFSTFQKQFKTSKAMVSKRDMFKKNYEIVCYVQNYFKVMSGVKVTF